ncbi:hypothetical protein [Cellulomonas xiejunii]|uniref:Uncharacterized protein n=1 Tax=Cellulomonas xiejunii TaxID=2968083 RepID=A0ABY5KW64_9CELL|nr:hypothetical protein [Cellulomonas xiejunii]MCC2322979.1 hypothetical protein [Cellulomonas xiejunii]UUI73477.1 hypothetical protein NP048_08635 [Cellulomonas xiejunii]
MAGRVREASAPVALVASVVLRGAAVVVLLGVRRAQLRDVTRAAPGAAA